MSEDTASHHPRFGVGRVLVALAACLSFGAGATAAPAPLPRAERPQPVDKDRIEFHMDHVPWSKVFVWLAEQTGIPVVTAYKLAGYFTFIGPKDARYTMPQIITIIRAALLVEKNLFLDRTERCFRLIPTDE
jgi:hypothetical protein